jgi:3-methyladenine DNA glycosylase AlkD
MVMTVIKEIRDELKLAENAYFAETSQRFFKENVIFHGLRTAEVTKIAKKYFRNIRSLGKIAIFELCEKLWKTGYQEESYIACEWSYALKKEYAETDFKIFEKWIVNYVDNWAKCDAFCNHTVGAFLELYPQCVSNLEKWAKVHNRWLQRASAVSLIIPLKKGMFADNIFRISDILIGSKDDLVQKGYGWALKVCTGKNLEKVCDFLKKRNGLMPRTAYRYAVEKMPSDLKREMIKLKQI